VVILVCLRLVVQTLNVVRLATHLLAHACLTMWAEPQTVAQNVQSVLNALAIWHVRTSVVGTLVQGHVGFRQLVL
jgi:hypothetical protein